MDQHIHTNFTSTTEAERAKEYLVSAGFNQVTIDGTQMKVMTNEENWIAAYEILNGLGGSFQEGESMPPGFMEHYQLEGDLEEGDPGQEVDMVDADRYIDINLGYGDFEIIEPYTLHDYNKLTQD